MSLQMLKVVGASILGASLLCACGGGGSGDGSAAPSTPTTLNFAANAGYKARIVSGSNDNFSLSGTCGGTAAINTGPANVPVTFEGVNGFSAAQTSTVTFAPGCTTQAPMVTGRTYYNSSFTPIGLAIDGGEYAKFEAPPTGLPTTAKVHTTGPIVTYLSYNDSTQAVRNGKRILTYSIDNDTSTTAILNIITTSVDLTGSTLSVQQSRYHMTESGALTLATITVDFNDAVKTKLIFTPR